MVFDAKMIYIGLKNLYYFNIVTHIYNLFVNVNQNVNTPLMYLSFIFNFFFVLIFEKDLLFIFFTHIYSRCREVFELIFVYMFNVHILYRITTFILIVKLTTRKTNAD